MPCLLCSKCVDTQTQKSFFLSTCAGFRSFSWSLQLTRMKTRRKRNCNENEAHHFSGILLRLVSLPLDSDTKQSPLSSYFKGRFCRQLKDIKLNTVLPPKPATILQASSSFHSRGGRKTNLKYSEERRR